MYDSITAIKYIQTKFPNLSEELYDDSSSGLVHIQMGTFSQFAQDVIDKSDRKVWTQVTQVFIDIWNDCQSEVMNALNVSFLENITFEDGRQKRSWAYREMPEIMRIAWDKMEAYNQKLHRDWQEKNL